MRACDSCRFCCWSFQVEDVPQTSDFHILQAKLPLAHCPHENDTGCALHETHPYPKGCREIICPYLWGEDIHRPDLFQATLESLRGNLGGYIPFIPTALPVPSVISLITQTRTVLAARIISHQWKQLVMPLDTDGGNWNPGKELLPPWTELLQKHGVGLLLHQAADPVWGSRPSPKNSRF